MLWDPGARTLLGDRGESREDAWAPAVPRPEPSLCHAYLDEFISLAQALFQHLHLVLQHGAQVLLAFQLLSAHRQDSTHKTKDPAPLPLAAKTREPQQGSLGFST